MRFIWHTGSASKRSSPDLVAAMTRHNVEALTAAAERYMAQGYSADDALTYAIRRSAAGEPL